MVHLGFKVQLAALLALRNSLDTGLHGMIPIAAIGSFLKPLLLDTVQGMNLTPVPGAVISDTGFGASQEAKILHLKMHTKLRLHSSL